MGREETALWYEAVDFTGVRILLIEWTHANSDNLHGVDVPVLLNSTPAETLAHRKARHRDGGTDSPFTTMVLALEQKQLEAQAVKAKLIVSKSGGAAHLRAVPQRDGGGRVMRADTATRRILRADAQRVPGQHGRNAQRISCAFFGLRGGAGRVFLGLYPAQSLQYRPGPRVFGDRLRAQRAVCRPGRSGRAPGRRASG